jgi:hypothetical protein
MESENVADEKYIPFTETLAIFGLTALTYWFVFKHECAYVGKYGIPIELLDININSILVALYRVSGAVLFFFFLANLISMIWPSHPVMRRKFIRVIVILLFPLWRLFSFGFRIDDWPYYVVPLSVVLIAEVFWPLIIHRKNGNSFLERSIADEESEEPVREKNLFGRIFNYFGPYYYLFLLALWLGSWLAKTSGESEAVNQKVYPVSINDSSVILIKAYSDKFICVRIGNEIKLVKSFLVLDPSEQEFEERIVGPLVFNKKNSK